MRSRAKTASAEPEVPAGDGTASPAARPRRNHGANGYRLEEQVGFILRRVSQRHMAIFAGHIDGDITPTRWAALAKLYESGPTSQNLLGRRTAMDAATIKGVVDRLTKLHLIETRGDPTDGRRRVVALTEAGRRQVERSLAHAGAITRKTLAPLSAAEQESFLALLRRLA
jgi:DNA-binding MarR family transcriptional regulator